ncbi:TonB-dependent receptor [Novosphingobium humi]|uniref:TonB-dependent receptor n=1 Tax=Novosphingobium humi TaxID=2282397 RepID=A0ABY7TY06_9SPHN|nr:TonB-dependent receptor [Novosphingobium humi]WCT77775.1 TonB-dependent receptor [Novosphingobium humi]
MKTHLLGGAAVALALSVATPAFAQSADAPAPAANSGDIVVTATRQSTLLSKTPVAMTAVTGDSLRSAGITDPRSLAQVAPNLAITESGDGVRIAIRGVTSTDGTEKGDPSAAFLLDGIYIARPQDQKGAFFDVAQVEVLRGPQGTLYGRNTTAGVVNVQSARPKAKWEGSFDAKIGNLNSQNYTGMINAPIGNSLGVRLAANFDRQDGNVLETASNPAYPLNPYRKIFSTRLSFGGDIGRLKFVVRGDWSSQRGSMTNVVPLSNFYTNTGTVGVNPTFIAGKSANAYRGLGYGQQYSSYKWNTTKGVMGEFTYALTDRIDVTYLGSYRESKQDFNQDLLFLGVLENPATFWGRYHQNSQELRLAFGKGNKLHGQAGGYYFEEKSYLNYTLGNPLSSMVYTGASGYAFPQGPTVSRSKAGFAQLTYDIIPGLHLTGGVRYTNDFKSRNGATVLYFPNQASVPSAFGSQCVGTTCTLNLNIASATFEKVTWKAGLDYDVPGLGLAYFNVSTGYKAGGFNDGCVSGSGLGCALSAGQLYYRPEQLTAYEGGVKFKFADGKVRFNASAFHYDYSNLQLSQAATLTDATTGAKVLQTLIQNAGTAKIDGVETETTLKPTPDDTFTIAANYTNARYSHFSPTNSSGQSVNFSGKQLDHAPKWTATVGYTRNFDLANGARVEAGVRTALSSDYYISDLNMLYQFRMPSYTKTDVTVTYKAPHDRWYIQGYAKNLENVITVANAVAGNTPAVTMEEPRTYGVRAGVKF